MNSATFFDGTSLSVVTKKDMPRRPTMNWDGTRGFTRKKPVAIEKLPVLALSKLGKDLLRFPAHHFFSIRFIPLHFHLFRIFRHVGNLGWALLRKKNSHGVSGEHDNALVERARAAVLEQCESNVTLLVHLDTSLESTIRRRQEDEYNRKRIPIQENVESECKELHDFLNADVKTHLETYEAAGIPTLIVENSRDGESSLDKTAMEIIKFIQSHLWRCAVYE